jgi:opacity protein-like surface antigen
MLCCIADNTRLRYLSGIILARGVRAMFGEIRIESAASLTPKRLAFGARTKSLFLGIGAFVPMLFSGQAAQAQCTPAGLNTTPLGPVVTQAAGMAIANVSASVGALASSINAVDTAFLTQSSAFIGSPANPQPGQPGGGVWARGVGGHVAYSTTATAGNINFGGPVSGTIMCNTRTLDDFAGVQVGSDIARLNVNGWNLHVGSTIGYMGSNTHDGTPGFNPSFRDSLQIPFAGFYGAASYGGFLIDGQVLGDFFQNEVSDDNHGLVGQRFNASGITLTGNVAYNQRLGNNWFIEPSAGIIWSRMRVDPLNVPGTGVVGMPIGPGFVPPWVLTVNDIDSTLGRLSARVGTTVTSGSIVWQPFASAGVFHEFQGGVTSSLTSNFSAISVSLPTLSSTVSTAGLGTYGQFGLGIAAQNTGSGWVGYLRGDYRTGDNIEGWSVNGGLRYQFVPDPVVRRPEKPIAKAPAYKAPSAQDGYDWSGLYIGAYLGTSWGSTTWTFTDDGDAANPRFAGLLGGGEIGYNYQTGKWVFGIEGDAGWTNAHGARSCPTGFFYTCEISTNWMSTATARVGYAYWDRVLVYAKGGAAIAQDRAESRCNTGAQSTIKAVVLVECPAQSDTKIKAGWTVGWGSEFGLTQNVSVKGEIMYFDLGSGRYDITGIPTDIRRNGFISSVGLHFRFGG